MPDESWLKALYDQHYQMLYSVGRMFVGHDEAQGGAVEDMIQETFLLLWQKRNRLFSHPNIGGWLVETLRKLLLNSLSKTRRRALRHGFAIDAMDPSALPLHDQTFPLPEVALEDSARMEALVNLLGEADAALFVAYYVNGITAKALSKDMNVSEDCVRMRATRLRKKVLANSALFLAIVSLFFVRF